MMTPAIGLAALAASVAAPLPAKPVYREVRDFVVACDNLRTCVARWAPEDGGTGFDAYLEISRDGGADGRLRISLSEMEAASPTGAPCGSTARRSAATSPGGSTRRPPPR